MPSSAGIEAGAAMEITVSKANLLKELTATQGVVERKTTIPILANFLFEAAGDKLSITDTGLDLSLRTARPAKGKKGGSCTMPAQVVRNLIAKTIFSISNEESRYTLNGALMVLKPESIVMVATDGHRLAHIEHNNSKLTVSGDMKVLVPKKAMAELNSLLNDSDIQEVEFARDESTLFFRIGSRLLTSRQLTGQFPNYEAVLPRDNNKSVTVHCDELSGAIQRVA